MGEGRLGVKVVGMEARFIWIFVDLTLKPQIFCVIRKQNLNLESNPWNFNMKWENEPDSVSRRWHLTVRNPFECRQAEESPEGAWEPASPVLTSCAHLSPDLHSEASKSHHGCICTTCYALLSHSVMSNSADMGCTHQSPLSMEFSRKEYWSGLPFPTPGNIPKPGIEPTSLQSSTLAGRFYITTAT